MFQVVGGCQGSYDEYLTCDRLYENRQLSKYNILQHFFYKNKPIKIQKQFVLQNGTKDKLRIYAIFLWTQILLYSFREIRILQSEDKQKYTFYSIYSTRLLKMFLSV